MKKLNVNALEKRLLRLNEFIHKDYDALDYHMNHIILTRDYLRELSKRMGYNIRKDIVIDYIGLCHDLLKERGLNPDNEVIWKGILIPQDTNRYVRENLDILEIYGLEDYFNSDLQYHALAAGIFLHKEFGIRDKNILYPIFFHSCIVPEIYESLSKDTQCLIDMTILADKLSSNWLRINMLDKEVCCDLDLILFGESGLEFNYSMALYMARLISNGKSSGELAKATTKYYYDKLVLSNMYIRKYISIEDTKIGGKKKWQKRHPRLRTQVRIS